MPICAICGDGWLSVMAGDPPAICGKCRRALYAGGQDPEAVLAKINAQGGARASSACTSCGAHEYAAPYDSYWSQPGGPSLHPREGLGAELGERDSKSACTSCGAHGCSAAADSYWSPPFRGVSLDPSHHSPTFRRTTECYYDYRTQTWRPVYE